MDPFKSSQEVQGLKDFGRKTPGPTIAATFILDGIRIFFCEERKWFQLFPRAMSGGYLSDSWLMSGIFQQKIPEVKDSDEN